MPPFRDDLATVAAQKHNPQSQLWICEKAQATGDQAERLRLTERMYRIQFDRGGWIIPFFANVENTHKIQTGGWPKNDFSGRTFGNAHFEQVNLASG